MQTASTPAILRRRQVEAKTGIPRSTLYQKIQDGEFPRPVALGRRSVGWLAHEVDGWLDAQIEKSRRVAA